MSKETMKAHIEEIEDLVIGQDVPVSYKKLSKQLSLHVNQSKKLLPAFVEENGAKTKLSESHLLSGKITPTEDGAFGWHVCIVHKEDLDGLKKSSFYESSSSHLYSVYKGNKMAIVTPELASRMNELGHELAGIKNCKVAISKENEKRKFTVNESAAPSLKKKVDEPKKPVKEEKTTKPLNNKTDVKTGDMAAEETKAEEPVEKTAKQTTANKTNTKKGGIANFFQRGNSNEAVKKESKPALKKPEEVKAAAEEPKAEEKSESKENRVAKVSVSKASAKRKPSKSKNGPADKKRKRIMIESDSEDSEDGMEIEEHEEVEPAPPTAVAVKEEPKDTGVCRERKLVDKVFKDEKGFLVTKKTFVTTETVVEKKEDAECKVEIEVKKEEKQTSEPPTLAKKKQPGIMSFFARK